MEKEEEEEDEEEEEEKEEVSGNKRLSTVDMSLSLPFPPFYSSSAYIHTLSLSLPCSFATNPLFTIPVIPLL
jgi:hypothetical protein